MVDENKAIVKLDQTALEALSLPLEEGLAPPEQLEKHLHHTKKIGGFGCAANNTYRWYLGIMYKRLMEQPEVYLNDEDDFPTNLSEATEYLDASRSSVTRARDIVANYTHSQWKNYRFLPFTAVYEALQLPPAKKVEVLDALFERWKQDDLKEGEAIQTVRDAIKKLESIPDASGPEEGDDDTEEDEDPTGSRPPITSLQSKMVALTKVVGSFRDAAGSYVYSQEDLANLEGLADTAQEVADDLRQAHSTAKNSQ